MVEPVVCDRRQDRQHTLMVFACYAVDLFNGHALHEDTVAPGKVKKFAGIFGLNIFLYKDFVDITSGLDGLDHGADAKYVVVAVQNNQWLCGCGGLE